MKRPYVRRCGASAPDSDARKGWHYCYHPAGHSGMHEDDNRMWQDNDTVEVRTVEEIATVHDHEHEFPQLGQDGSATCSMDPECMLTWNEYQKPHAWWEEEQADTCSHCGHAEHCHTTSLPEEGYRDYCTECEGPDEFHAMDEEPKVLPVTRERLMEIVRGLLPNAPQERLEAAVDRMRVMLTLADPEPTEGPEKAMTARLEGVRPQGVVVDEVMWGQVAVTVPDTDPDEDLAVECECGRVWPDGVLGKGHNDMDCDQDEPKLPDIAQQQDVCAVPGCGHWEHEHEYRGGERKHCAVCHTVNPTSRACLHVFHPPVKDEPEIPGAPQNDMGEDVCFCGCRRKEHRKSLTWGESCDGCSAKGPRATYQWRHPFQRDVGRIKR